MKKLLAVFIFLISLGIAAQGTIEKVKIMYPQTHEALATVYTYEEYAKALQELRKEHKVYIFCVDFYNTDGTIIHSEGKLKL